MKLQIVCLGIDKLCCRNCQNGLSVGFFYKMEYEVMADHFNIYVIFYPATLKETKNAMISFNTKRSFH